ncbi:hypothetical protein FRC12_009305 [Ceratobasidium sp. 428]|nr:hypothetical protein FRC12_009305 [Ceratobasidium sp. 428]
MNDAASAKNITYLVSGHLAHGPLVDLLLLLRRYVTYLETQVGKLERKLREILPGINLNRELETLAQIAAPPHAPQISAHSNRPQPDPSSNTAPSSYPIVPPPVYVTNPYGVSAAPMLLKHVRLASDVKTKSELPYNQVQYHSSLRNDTYWSETASTRPKEPRYHGQSSGEILLRDAKELKREFEELSLGDYEETSTSNQRNGPSRFEVATYPMPDPPKTSEPPPLDETCKTSHIRIRPRRPEFWRPTLPEQRALSRDVWATSPPSPSSPLSETHLNEVVLPPPDLIKSLVDLFFIHINSITPIFHRQAFEQELASGTHLLQVLQWRTQNNQDGRVGNPKAAQYPNLVIDQTRGAGTFARVVLLVCACASRWSGDPRVLSNSPVDETENNYELSTLSAGYSFFRQVDPWCRTMCAQAGLWDVQMFLVSPFNFRPALHANQIALHPYPFMISSCQHCISMAHPHLTVLGLSSVPGLD